MKKICCFAGHGKIYYDEEVRTQLKEQIIKSITEENITEFWVGNYGNFDRLCAGCVRNLKNLYPQIRLYLLIPYLTAEINHDKEYYKKNFDGILVADLPEPIPKKLRILKCNEYMIDCAEYLICYVEFETGGAKKTLNYAKKKNFIKIYNIAKNRNKMQKYSKS